ncbi:MAG TPA: non-homologous end-joining DNA ligase [Polyangiaceae bacterium]|nr:non-homologous end-joining DNA ligase [Polyangiaceae bacterium]
MVEVTHPERVVYPDAGRTKGDVVRYYERIAPRLLPHVAGRPLSIRRYPQGLEGPGFFQKNVPPHYPKDIERFAVPRSQAASRKHSGKQSDVTIYPLLSREEQLAYLANQGAIELHVPTLRARDDWKPDRLVIDLDPPQGAVDLVRKAATWTRTALAEWGLESVPVATGSKGYHIVAALKAELPVDELALAAHQFATLLVARHPDELTITYRVAERGGRVFVDWLRLGLGSVVAPYSLRATPRATVAAPLAWDELSTTAPDAFTIDDAARLLDRPDALAVLAQRPAQPAGFVEQVGAAFERSGLTLKRFDRFRS